MDTINKQDYECDVSVVICAYNAERRLPEVLEALAVQNVPQGLSWEVLLVDNNSNDKTSDVAKKYVSKIGDGSILSVLSEPNQGLIYARRCGWREAKGSIISFLDDDNIVSPDWVQEVWHFFQTHSNAGIVGPKIFPLMDFEPPEYFNYIKLSLAIWDLGNEALNTTHTQFGHPPGAGMSCRSNALAPILGCSDFQLTGRKGEQLISGEDSMIAFLIRNAGWDWWYEPKMLLWHRLPKSRMELPYLLRLFKGMGLSSVEIASIKKGHSLNTKENINYILKYLSRFLYYQLVKYFHLSFSKRVYAMLLVSMFSSGLKQHIFAILKKSNIRNIG